MSSLLRQLQFNHLIFNLRQKSGLEISSAGPLAVVVCVMVICYVTDSDFDLRSYLISVLQKGGRRLFSTPVTKPNNQQQLSRICGAAVCFKIEIGQSVVNSCRNYEKNQQSDFLRSGDTVSVKGYE